MTAPALSLARDAGLFPLPFGDDRFNTSLVYSRVDEEDDFDGRGIVKTKGHLVLTELGYTFLDKTVVSLRGGVLSESEQTAQGARWMSRAGYIYGLAFRHQVFPPT